MTPENTARARLWVKTVTIDDVRQRMAEGAARLRSIGVTARSVEALMACGERFAYIDILANPDIRANLPQYSDWPTFPQLFVDGELVGGCDIIAEMYQSGELQPIIKAAAEAAQKEDG